MLFLNGQNSQNQSTEYDLIMNFSIIKIGCGLDMLDWNAVRTIIKNIFLDTPIRIDVYILESEALKSENKISAASSSKFNLDRQSTIKKYPMLDIAEGNLTPIFNQDRKGITAGKDAILDEVLRYKNLPDLFVGDKMFLQEGMEDIDTLKRYIISVRKIF